MRRVGAVTVGSRTARFGRSVRIHDAAPGYSCVYSGRQSSGPNGVMSIPADVAVTGWDDIAMASFTHPTLTTIAADTTALADTALDLLQERIGGFEGLGRHLVVPHRLVIRESAPSAH